MPTSTPLKISRRYLGLLVLLVIGLYVLVPQLGDFGSSWHQLSHPKLGWTAVAVVLTLLTYFAGALTYYLLSFSPLKYSKTVLMQFAAMFVNRLLPGGIGALGANFAYLKKNKHSSPQAASVVTVNNILGATGHNLLLLIILFTTGYSTINSNSSSDSSPTKYILIGAMLALLLGLLFGHKKLLKFISDTKTQLLDYRHRPGKLILAQTSSIILTICNVLSLYACALALGVHLNFAIVMLIFTFGVSAGTVTPTPGGLGGFEAGLVAGFIAYKVDHSTALAIALLYRLISYWLTLAIGAVAFVMAQRRQLI
jgi:uncharacterized membrane protein YbhN (UPF0104 family)